MGHGSTVSRATIPAHGSSAELEPWATVPDHGSTAEP